MRPRLVVLKFGSSVLTDRHAVPRVVQEVYRWKRRGYRVVAVVSAIGNVTDELLEAAPESDSLHAQSVTAHLLAGGERQSAALVASALESSGIAAAVSDEVQTGLITEGPALDAAPVALDRERLTSLLDTGLTLVIPGFIGRDPQGHVTLLGRGGSDLTALFVANELKADTCRLLKDVDGLYEHDPAESPAARRFRTIRFEDALKLDEGIVQHKGLDYARRHQYAFEVSGLFSNDPTRVGPYPESHLEPSTIAGVKRRRLRVVLLGAGTVGGGVLQRLTQSFAREFEVVGVLVRDRDKAIARGIPESLILDDPHAAIGDQCDVVVEALGGTGLARHLVAWALSYGRHVVTANKTLVAAWGRQLIEASRQYGGSLAWSASVGGSTPVLETVRALRRQGETIVGVTAVLNGTANFVADRLAAGQSLDEAIDTAIQRGMAEADSSRDLDGLDAADKLALIAAELGFQLDPDQVRCQSLADALAQCERTGPEGNAARHGTSAVLRQVARLDCKSSDDSESAATQCRAATSGHVDWQWTDPASPLADVHGAENEVALQTSEGNTVHVRGIGAGRWPTTTSVVADLLDLTIHPLPQTSLIEPGVSQRTAASATTTTPVGG